MAKSNYKFLSQSVHFVQIKFNQNKITSIRMLMLIKYVCFSSYSCNLLGFATNSSGSREDGTSESQGWWRWLLIRCANYARHVWAMQCIYWTSVSEFIWSKVNCSIDSVELNTVARPNVTADYTSNGSQFSKTQYSPSSHAYYYLIIGMEVLVPPVRSIGFSVRKVRGICFGERSF